MRFAVDAHAIGRHLTGNEVYIRNLLEGFAALDQSSEFIAYISKSPTGADPPVPQRFKRKYVSANSIKRLGVDLSRRIRKIALPCPCPVHGPLSCAAPIVVSVHDISFLERPEYFPWWRAMQFDDREEHYPRAARVITPSEFSRKRILEAYQPDPAKVEVVPIAPSSTFRPVPREGAFRWVAERSDSSAFRSDRRRPAARKNQIGLIRAFEELVQRIPSSAQTRDRRQEDLVCRPNCETRPRTRALPTGSSTPASSTTTNSCSSTTPAT